MEGLPVFKINACISLCSHSNCFIAELDLSVTSLKLCQCFLEVLPSPFLLTSDWEFKGPDSLRTETEQVMSWSHCCACSLFQRKTRISFSLDPQQKMCAVSTPFTSLRTGNLRRKKKPGLIFFLSVWSLPVKQNLSHGTVTTFVVGLF